MLVYADVCWRMLTCGAWECVAHSGYEAQKAFMEAVSLPAAVGAQARSEISVLILLHLCPHAPCVPSHVFDLLYMSPHTTTKKQKM